MKNPELEEFEENLIKALKGGNKDYISAYNRVLDQYGYTHGRRNDNTCQVFNALYAESLEGARFEVADQFGISDSTLLRRRKEFRNCFCYYLKIVRAEKTVESEAALSEDINTKKG